MSASLLDERPVMRYCAFLDILGFKSILEHIEGNPKSPVTERLISALNFMALEVNDPAYSADLPVYELVDDVLIERELGDPRLTYVSDCVIISAEHTPDGLKALCRKVSKIWLDLAWDGFFCRGAISDGLLFHHRNIVFGSAYLNAYYLEPKAIFPRVIIDPKVITALGGFPQAFPLRDPTSSVAADGFVYLRYFPRAFFPPYAHDWSNYLVRIRSHLVDSLATTSGSVYEKYSFLRDEFNFAVNHYRDFLEPGLQPLDTP